MRGGGAVPRKDGQAKRDDLGDALKNVYGGALDEEIPPEMLDLLGKLS